MWSQPTTYQAEMRRREKTPEGVTDTAGFEPGSKLTSGRRQELFISHRGRVNTGSGLWLTVYLSHQLSTRLPFSGNNTSFSFGGPLSPSLDRAPNSGWGQISGFHALLRESGSRDAPSQDKSKATPGRWDSWEVGALSSRSWKLLVAMCTPHRIPERTQRRVKSRGEETIWSLQPTSPSLRGFLPLCQLAGFL